MNDGWELVAMNARAEVERLRAEVAEANGIARVRVDIARKAMAHRDRLLAAIGDPESSDEPFEPWIVRIVATAAEVRAEMGETRVGEMIRVIEEQMEEDR